LPLLLESPSSLESVPSSVDVESSSLTSASGVWALPSSISGHEASTEQDMEPSPLLSLGLTDKADVVVACCEAAAPTSEAADMRLSAVMPVAESSVVF